VVNLMHPGHVECVLIAGKLRKWRGQLVGIDLARAMRLAEEARTAVMRRAGFKVDLLGGPWNKRFMHSENLADHERCRELCRAAEDQEGFAYAEEQAAIIISCCGGCHARNRRCACLRLSSSSGSRSSTSCARRI
jgi:uncharacterized protein (DUF924 family)